MPGSSPDNVRTTTLEMSRAPRKYPSLQTKSKLAIMQASNIPLPFYRFLYGEVGRSHYWYLRNHLNDAELTAIIHSEQTRINILYYDGAPAGFVEIDLSQLPEILEIIYFGLCPQFIGRGLGKWFMGQSIQFAWDQKPEKIVISTDSLDHPHALPSYQKLGFNVVSYKDETMEEWLRHQG